MTTFLPTSGGPGPEIILADIEYPIQDFISCLGQAQQRGTAIPRLSGLPASFSVVNENLPLVYSEATSLGEKLKAHAKMQMVAQDLLLVKEVATRGHEQALLIRKQFTAVTSSDDLQKNLARYHAAVCDDGQGVPVEEAMQELLLVMKNLSSTPFVDQDFGTRIEQAARQVREAEASIPDDMPAGKGHTFYNTGSGIQSIHAGRGNQNNNYGSGPFVQGDAASVTLHSGNGVAERVEEKSLRRGCA